MIVNRIVVGTRTYEQRFNRCGRRNCRRCYGAAAAPPGRPGHGPYWYIVLSTKRGIRRIYIGKILDTAKFILPNGSIDAGALVRIAAAKLANPQPDVALPF